MAEEKQTIQCPHCNKEVAPNDLDRHLEVCPNLLPEVPLTPGQLRTYLKKKIIHKHPKCPVCKSRYTTAITKMILEQEPYDDIIERFSGKGNQPEFTKPHLSNHKKHLHLDQVAILERNAKTLNTPTTYGVEEIDYRNSANSKLLQVISAAILDKQRKMNSLELVQVAKLQIASDLFNRLTKKKEFLERQDIDTESFTLEDWLAYVSDVDKMEIRYLKYMNSIGELQVKMLKMFEDFKGNKEGLNMNIILTTLQSGEMDVLKFVANSVENKQERIAITQGVGDIFNNMNNELKRILQNEDIDDGLSPVDAVYEDVKTSTMEGLHVQNSTDK